MTSDTYNVIQRRVSSMKNYASNGVRKARAGGPGAALAVCGGALIAAACINYLVARQTERRHPPAGKFIEVDGVRLHYFDKGTGTPVVLLHGNGMMAEDFEISGLSDLLATDHRVITFDRPGFGYSERPRGTVWTAEAQGAVIHKALQQMRIRRPVLVGHSWGTLVALAMALDDPLETAALVLLSGYYVPSIRMDVPLTLWPAIPVLGDVIRYTIAPLLGLIMFPRVIQKSFAPCPVTEPFETRFPSAMALRPSQIRATAADAALMIPVAAAMLGRYGELKMPVIIMAGAADEIVSLEPQSGQLHADILQSKLHEVEGAGHMIHQPKNGSWRWTRG
jgi:pimeloyl-ACP methyl ester carboxylesterase